MKILHVVNRLFPGGAQTMLLSLLQIEKALGYEPRVLYLKDQNTLFDRIDGLGVEQHTLGIKRFVPSLTDLSRVPAMLRHWKPDVVQAWMYHSDLASLYLRYISRIDAPIVWSVHHSIHALEQEKFNTRLVIRALRKIDWIPYKTVFVSRTSADQHIGLGYNPNKIEIIPNGFDLERFKPDSSTRAIVRKEFGISEPERLVGIFGRYDPVKDFGNFFTAMKLVLSTDGLQNTKIVLCGRDQTSENRKLAGMVEKHGLQDKVMYLGQRDDVERIYASVDVVVNSSKSEAFPMTVGEAMSCAIPCVVTDVGDSGWLVGNAGKVVPRCDSKLLAEGIVTLLELTPTERSAIGLIARQRISDDFSLQSVAGRYHNLYQRASRRDAA